MADTYKGLYLEPDWIPALLAFAPSELGRLIRCAILYSASGQAPDLPGKERVLWPYIQSQIDQTCSAPHGKKQAPANPEKEPGIAGLGGALPAAAAPGLNYNLPSSAVAEAPPEKEREETSPIPPKEEIERLPPVNNINNNNINNNIGGSGGSPRFRPPSLKEKKATPFEVFARENSPDRESETALLKALRDFELMRNKIKKPLTDSAVERLLAKLQKSFQKEDWVQVLNQSTDHCWQDLYQLKVPEDLKPARGKKQFTTQEEYDSKPSSINTSQMDKIQAIFGGAT